jgi:hypothetical protein
MKNKEFLDREKEKASEQSTSSENLVITYSKIWISNKFIIVYVFENSAM